MQITIDIPEHFLEGIDWGAARQPDAVVKWLLAAKLVAVGRVSTGRAAEWLGVTRPEFLQEMGRYGVSALPVGEDMGENG